MYFKKLSIQKLKYKSYLRVLIDFNSLTSTPQSNINLVFHFSSQWFSKDKYQHVILSPLYLSWRWHMIIPLLFLILAKEQSDIISMLCLPNNFTKFRTTILTSINREGSQQKGIRIVFWSHTNRPKLGKKLGKGIWKFFFLRNYWSSLS